MTQRSQRLQAIRQQLANLSDTERQTLANRGIIATIEGRTLSLHNTIMVYLQSNGRTPTVVGGYQQWRKAGRQVKKGEHGAIIFFPVGDKDNETGDIVSADNFFTAIVFDISQTEPIEK